MNPFNPAFALVFKFSFSQKELTAELVSVISHAYPTQQPLGVHMKSLCPATRLLLCGGVLGLTSLASSPASASEKDELASAQRMIVQVQASLERARIAAVQADPSERGRYFFDYQRANSDLKTISSGIDRYLEPTRAQPRDLSGVAGNYRRERP
ncbi:Plasmid conserved hypothetical family protein (plasmid) [Erwinia billingiae Eb661]|uniref:Plasmid conserved hypothetical family protein n=2 Tax=Gammaproteobacteria TaxID=1236 RepID=D8MJE8_ERWBE|nr:Plasmid conserved hypothetical family protein [Erwinia billingiae Eb661]